MSATYLPNLTFYLQLLWWVANGLMMLAVSSFLISYFVVYGLLLFVSMVVSLTVFGLMLMALSLTFRFFQVTNSSCLTSMLIKTPF